MSRFILLCLAAFLLIGSVTAADLPFVFGEDTPPLGGLSAAELQDLAASAPAGVPAISQVPEDELMEWTEVGGTTVASGATKSTAGELKAIFNSRVEPGDELVHETCITAAFDHPGEYSLYQVCAIYEYLNTGDESTGGWKYFPDPHGVDLYNYANFTVSKGKEKGVSGYGDCDDFAILMASLVESISGTTRIILAFNQTVGHAYTEVYLGSVNEAGSQVEDVIEALKKRYGVSKVFTHLDTTTGDVWLNLDWWPDGGVLHPGGPFFPGTKHVPLRIRDQYGKTPIRPPEGFTPRPAREAPAMEMPVADSTGLTVLYPEMEAKILVAVDPTNPITRNKAVEIASQFSGSYNVQQLCSIYHFVKDNWCYVVDPRGADFFSSASETITLAESIAKMDNATVAGVGDCDDFAILMASLIEAIGGTTRIVMAYDERGGHAYAEVYVGQLDKDQTTAILSWLRSRYRCPMIYGHNNKDDRGFWLNLDWNADHPGGPFYQADEHFVVHIGDEDYKRGLSLPPSYE